jgi:glycosyltransferase involved in cell wall biosynthesis
MSRVVVIASYAPSLTRFREHFLRALRAAGHDVTAIAPADADVAARLGELGVAFRHCPLDRAGMNPLHDVAYLLRLARILRSLRPDAVLAYTVKPVIWGLLAARLAGVRQRFALITGLGYAFTQAGQAGGRVTLAALLSALYRHALRGCRVVFFQNPDDRQEFAARRHLAAGQRTVVVNGSGVDLDAYRPQPPPASLSFLLIARLLRDKGIREYVAAARMVRQAHPEVRFRLAGWLDPNPAAISAGELASWTASGDIEYLGVLTDVRPALKDCAVYVLPSYREGTPRTVLEAMATGRPVITTDVPGCRETVRHGENGFLVPAADPAALAAAMTRFIEHPALVGTMGAAGRRIAEQRYNAADVARVMVEAMQIQALRDPSI